MIRKPARSWAKAAPAKRVAKEHATPATRPILSHLLEVIVLPQSKCATPEPRALISTQLRIEKREAHQNAIHEHSFV